MSNTSRKLISTTPGILLHGH